MEKGVIRLTNRFEVMNTATEHQRAVNANTNIPFSCWWIGQLRSCEALSLFTSPVVDGSKRLKSYLVFRSAYKHKYATSNSITSTYR